MSTHNIGFFMKKEAKLSLNYYQIRTLSLLLIKALVYAGMSSVELYKA